MVDNSQRYILNVNSMLSFAGWKYQNINMRRDVIAMMKHCCSILLLFVSVFAFAQHPCIPKTESPETVKKYCAKAKKARKKHKQDKAISYYKKAVKKCPDCLYPHLQLAMIYYRSGKFEPAAEQLEWLVSCDSGTKPEWNYFLADSYKRSGRYEMVRSPAQKYLSSGKTSNKLKKAGEKLVRDADFAAKAVKHPVSSKPVLLGPEINTDKNDYFPMLTAESDELIFTSRIGQREYLFHSYRKNGRWSRAKVLNILDNTIENGAHTVSPSGKYIIFSSCDAATGYGHCDLYHIWKKPDGRWTKPANMGPVINSHYWESQPSLGENGRVLYFVSRRPGGFGGNDIYVSHRDKEGHWSHPVNLGPPVNTPEDDQAPFIHADGETLYFASAGHPGMGDMDIFVTRKDSTGHWSRPVNLGYPVNTEGHEGCISISLDGREGFVVSDRKYLDRIRRGQREGAETNIYHFIPYPAIRPKPVTYVKVRLSDRDHRPLKGVAITILRLNDMQLHFKGMTDSLGESLACLPAGVSYAFYASKAGFIPYSGHFYPPVTDSVLKPYLLHITLDTIPLPQLHDTERDTQIYTRPVILKNVFFTVNSAELKPQSTFELDKLVALLLRYPDMKIRISGHTDNTGNDRINLPLSEARARAVCQYMIRKGIEATRLKCVGYGSMLPVADNSTEEGRRMNRRTTFEILKE